MNLKPRKIALLTILALLGGFGLKTVFVLYSLNVETYAQSKGVDKIWAWRWGAILAIFNQPAVLWCLATAFIAGCALGMRLDTLLRLPALRVLTIGRSSRSPVADESEYILIEDAGRHLYEHASDEMKELLRFKLGDTYSSVAEHGAAWVTQAAIEGLYDLFGRLEPGLPMEKIDIEGGGDFQTFEGVCGPKGKRLVDLSIRRADLQKLTERYRKS